MAVKRRKYNLTPIGTLITEKTIELNLSLSHYVLAQRVGIGSMARTAAINGAMALKNMALGLIGMAKQAIITAATTMPGIIATIFVLLRS